MPRRFRRGSAATSPCGRARLPLHRPAGPATPFVAFGQKPGPTAAGVWRALPAPVRPRCRTDALPFAASGRKGGFGAARAWRARSAPARTRCGTDRRLCRFRAKAWTGAARVWRARSAPARPPGRFAAPAVRVAAGPTSRHDSPILDECPSHVGDRVGRSSRARVRRRRAAASAVRVVVSGAWLRVRRVSGHGLAFGISRGSTVLFLFSKRQAFAPSSYGGARYGRTPARTQSRNSSSPFSAGKATMQGRS